MEVSEPLRVKASLKISFLGAQLEENSWCKSSIEALDSTRVYLTKKVVRSTPSLLPSFIFVPWQNWKYYCLVEWDVWAVLPFSKLWNYAQTKECKILPPDSALAKESYCTLSKLTLYILVGRRQPQPQFYFRPQYTTSVYVYTAFAFPRKADIIITMYVHHPLQIQWDVQEVQARLKH
jgi:hypothetical protein